MNEEFRTEEQEMVDELSGLTVDDETVVEDSNIHDFMQETPDNDESEEEPAEEKKPKRGRPKKQQDIDNPSNISIEDEIDIPDDAMEETDPANDAYYNNVYNTFKDLGIIDGVELEEGKVLTNDELVSILDNDQKAKAKKMFENDIMSKFNDPEAQEYLQFVMNGGNSKDFFRQRMNAPTIDIDGDIENPDVQDKIIAKYMKMFENANIDDINETIQILNDSGKKERYAKRYYDRLVEVENKQREDLKKEEENRARQAEEERKQVIGIVANELNSTDEIFGVKYDTNKKNKLMQMIFQPVKMQDGTVTTEYQYRLEQAMQNPKTVIILADLLMNGLDHKNYSKSLETKITRQIRSGLDSKPNERKRQTSPFDNLFKK